MNPALLRKRKIPTVLAGGGGVVTYTISGTVYASDGSTPVSGATVALGAYSDTSAGDGTYTITGLPAGASGTMTCTLDGYIWPTISVSSMSGNLTAQNYTALAPLGWYDMSDAARLFTDAGSTPVSGDGDLIYQCNDKSGNGNNLAQSNSVLRAAYKVNIQNSLSVMRLDNSNDIYPWPITSAAGAFTFIYCFNITVLPATSRIFDIASSRIILTAREAGNANWGYYTDATGFVHSSTPGATGKYIVTLDLRATNQVAIRLNGSNILTGGALASNLAINAGGTDAIFYPYAPDIYEVLVFKGLDTANIPYAETYMNNKWSVF